jgi:exodeoxyribonuclease-3
MRNDFLRYHQQWYCKLQLPLTKYLMAVEIDRIISIIEREVVNYRVPVVDLIAVQTREPFKVLVATILSARTRDEVTAKAAARLFKRAADAPGLARLSEAQIARLIYPVGFYKNKAAYLSKLPAALTTLFNGRIPATVEELVNLPGVGRKTANLVVAVAFGKPAICVDTHVHRIMNIWGYVRTRTPLETEMALRNKLPARYWQRINSLLVAFGQNICRPQRPACDICVIREYCPQIGVTPRQPPGMKKKMDSGTKTFLSWNVNGIRALEKKGLAATIRELGPDIIGLQEIKAQPEQLTDDLKNIPGYTAFWHWAERKGYAGVCTYTKKEPHRVIQGLGIEEHDREGRVLTLEFDDFFFVNAYFPNAQPKLVRLDYKLAFNRDFLAFVNGLSARKSVVICGDFNVAHKPIDLKNPQQNMNNPGFSAPERTWMDEFINNGYLDTFRKFNQEPGQYTWWTYRFNARAKNIGWRIDYFCVDKKSENRVAGAAILEDIMGSDHCPVRLDFK